MGSAIPVIGVSVSEAADIKRAKIRRVLDEMLEKLDSDLSVPNSDIIVLDEYAGPGYTVPTPESHDAVCRIARREGLLLDPVYTAKAMAGLLDLASRGRLFGDVVFLHTGGAPALFAYNDDFLASDPFRKVSIAC